MRPKGQVLHKLKQVQTRHLHKLLDSRLRERPENCRHNGTLIGDRGEDEVRVCEYQGDEPYNPCGEVCDNRFDGVRKAQDCPLFKAAQAKASLKADFQELMTNGAIGEIAALFPDIAALRWVLSDGEEEEVEAVQEDLGVKLEAEVARLEEELVTERRTIADQKVEISRLRREVGRLQEDLRRAQAPSRFQRVVDAFFRS